MLGDLVSESKAEELGRLALPVLRVLRGAGLNDREEPRAVFLDDERLMRADCTYEVAKAISANGLAQLLLRRPPGSGPYDPGVIDEDFCLRITPAGQFFLDLFGGQS